MRKDVVELFQDLESGETPLYYVAPETKTEVIFPKYDKPTGGPVKHLTAEEYLATRRPKVG